jgi:ferric-dicitrate binding protein FerR (iron transport regulator)
MTAPLCQWLDDYLARDLGGADHARFVAHLPECPECRRAVDDNERLVALLAQAAESEPIPTGLTERVARRLRVARRRRRAAMAAAALVTAVIAGMLLHRPAPRPSEPATSVADVRPATSDTRPTSPVRVTFPPSAHVSAVPVRTESPNVTFLWVFRDTDLSVKRND